MSESDTLSATEIHLFNILSGDKKIQKSYKHFLMKVFNAIKNSSFDIDEGDHYIRFNVPSDYLGIGKHYFLFEIGDIIPTIRWRLLIRTNISLRQVWLSKKVVFIPVYSYYLDRLTTFIYWGRKQTLLDPEQLSSLNFRNFLYILSSPQQVKTSLANLTWPRKLGSVHTGSTYVGGLYLFNCLYPPRISDAHNLWFEAPFVILGNNKVELITLHKTICSVSLERIKSKREVVIVPATILDNKLNETRIKAAIPKEFLDQIEDKTAFEAILVKKVDVYKKGINKKPWYRFEIYPFASSQVFKESQGLLSTVTSIILRRHYLKSSDPFVLTINISKLSEKVKEILGLKMFRNIKWNKVGYRLLNAIDGSRILVNSLGVYREKEDKIVYLHPSLLEAVQILLPQHRHKDVKLRDSSKALFEVYDYVERKGDLDFTDLFEIEEILNKRLEKRISIEQARWLMNSLDFLKKDVIPLSKTLNAV